MSNRMEQFQLTQDTAVQQQLAGCLLNAAQEVLNESSDAPDHTARLAWARQILQQAQGQAGMVMPYLVTNATIMAAAGGPPDPNSTTPVKDADLDYFVSSNFTALAHQFTGQ